MNKVFISTSSFGIEKSILGLLEKKRILYKINPFKRKLTEKEIKKILSEGYNGLIAGTESLTANVLKHAKNLKVISRVGVGLDNIDLKTAQKLGIKIYNTPDAVTDSVVELTIGLILNALRKICFLDNNLKSNQWKKSMGSLLKGKIVGIIGFGRIGKRVAEILNFMGAKIIFYDILKKDSKFKQVEITEIFSKSDIITFHASDKKPLLTEDKFKLLKNSVIIVNTARGELIDEEALYFALKNQKIKWACLDVFKKEPYNGKLLELDNITLTPHIGSYAKEARAEMEYQAVINLLKGLNLIDN